MQLGAPAPASGHAAGAPELDPELEPEDAPELDAPEVDEPELEGEPEPDGTPELDDEPEVWDEPEPENDPEPGVEPEPDPDREPDRDAAPDEELAPDPNAEPEVEGLLLPLRLAPPSSMPGEVVSGVPHAVPMATAQVPTSTLRTMLLRPVRGVLSDAMAKPSPLHESTPSGPGR